MSWRSNGRPDQPPFVLSGRIVNAMRLTALEAEAEQAGLRCDMSVTEARAICPQVEVLAADPAADRAFLEGLADWCSRYTPLVALAGCDGLHLDITGCAHLMGGEKTLLSDLLGRLFHLGLEARAVISSSAGLSFAVSRFGRNGIIEPGDNDRWLGPLPVAALRLPAETVGMLARVGLQRIEDLMGLPRAPLARRFGREVLLRLDQARGLLEEPLSPRMPVAPHSAERRLAEPIQAEEDVQQVVGQLARSLASGLEARGEGGRHFELLLFRVDGKVFRVTVGASLPLSRPGAMADLFRERLAVLQDGLDAGCGFEILRLSILVAEKLQPVQEHFAGAQDTDRPLAAFVDRVAARFGPDRLLMPVLCESHVPERASTLLAADMAARSAGADLPLPHTLSGARPLRLLTHPEPVEATAEIPDGAPAGFRWRRVFHRICRAEGPERIAAEWWIDGQEAPTRDYFRVEDEDGRRFWLFRRGLYGREPEMPRWFLHGVFA